jgi:threonylcarbamoyladenosine tRNA methylthiotransferase MtaB
MPQLPREVVHERAARLRAAGEVALTRHLERTVGHHVTALVERAGRARAEDYTEVAFDGAATPGDLISGRIDDHDTKRARLGDWVAL